MLNGLFDLRLDRVDDHRERAFVAADDAGGLDALGGRDDLRLGRGRGHDRVGVRQRQDGQTPGLLPVAGIVGLDIAAVEAHGIAVDGLIRAVDEAVKKEQQHQAEHDGDHGDEASVASCATCCARPI